MDKRTLIEKIRQLETLSDLLSLLNEVKAELSGSYAYPFRMKQLIILCNPNLCTEQYRTFPIAKKTGGKRVICAPNDNLKWFQLCLNEIFKAVYTPSPYAMGFVSGRSVVDNALKHTNQHFVFNIDLKDFFPSIEQTRVWKRLLHEPFNFPKKIADVVAGLCCMKIESQSEEESYRFVLPQGAPTSPLLTNAICDNLDRCLHGLARRFGLRYSRYADDITFSSPHNVYHENGEFRKELSRIITEQGFTINDKKTRLQHCSGRQEVTGLTVGSKVNVARKYVKDIRAILHIWEKYGENAAYAAFYPRYKAAKGHLHKGIGIPNLENVISGKLCYLKMVKGENDPVYVKLKTQFERVCNRLRPQHSQDWEYLFTLPKIEFEERLGTKVEIHKTKYYEPPMPYATFSIDGRSFLIAISKSINPDAIPGDAEISLCRVTKNLRDPLLYVEKRKKNYYGKIYKIVKMLYLLHRRHNTAYKQNAASSKPIPPDSLREQILALANLLSDFQLRDDFGVIEQSQTEQLLDRLVSSNFDLSILP